MSAIPEKKIFDGAEDPRVIYIALLDYLISVAPAAGYQSDLTTLAELKQAAVTSFRLKKKIQ